MINVGIIGCGYWGPKLIRNFNHNEQCCIRMAADLNPRRLDAIRKDYPHLALSENPLELIQSPDIDAVAIATPVCSHFELGKKALENGKHVLVEKPMTKTVQEAASLIALAERNNLVLMVDHTFLYTSAVQKIKKVIDNNDLGEIYYFDSVRVNLGLFQHDVNVVWDLAPHDLSIMQFLINEPPVSLSATGACHFNYCRKALENIAYLTLNFQSGLIAHFHVNWVSPVKVRKMLVGGSKKMIVYDDLVSDEKIKIYDKGVKVENPEAIYEALVQYRVGDVHIPVIQRQEALAVECDHFLNCIQKREKPISDGAMGLEVVRLLEASDASLKSGGLPISLMN